MSKYEAGTRCGRLTLRSVIGYRDGEPYKWLCGCDCGVETMAYSRDLDQGKSSCGCAGKFSRDRLKKIWSGMIHRCHSVLPNSPTFRFYRGRGISVCDRWLQSFCAFVEDMGHPLPGQTIDRIDANGNYEPSNVRWADLKTQSRNRRMYSGKVWNDYFLMPSLPYRIHPKAAQLDAQFIKESIVYTAS